MIRKPSPAEAQALRRVLKLQMPVVQEQLLGFAASKSREDLARGAYAWTEFELPGGARVQIHGTLRVDWRDDPAPPRAAEPRKALPAPPLRLTGPAR